MRHVHCKCCTRPSSTVITFLYSCLLQSTHTHTAFSNQISAHVLFTVDQIDCICQCNFISSLLVFDLHVAHSFHRLPQSAAPARLQSTERTALTCELAVALAQLSRHICRLAAKAPMIYDSTIVDKITSNSPTVRPSFSPLLLDDFGCCACLCRCFSTKVATTASALVDTLALLFLSLAKFDSLFGSSFWAAQLLLALFENAQVSYKQMKKESCS